jgi:DMSO/TMAO reductase YedYZ molybdopterin-dependent catalytic subunit
LIARLPPGQRARSDFPRFGLPAYARRFPQADRIVLEITGNVALTTAVSDAWHDLPRTTLTADFHCVTTWSHRGLVWSGVRFRDFHERLVVPQARPAAGITRVVFRCLDGYRTGLPLEDLLDDQVLLADWLQGQPLCALHGAPLRLVAPAHYGYKSAKHLKAIEYWIDPARDRPKRPRFLDHPRARVALEERGREAPGWLLRWVYRPLIGPGRWLYARAEREHGGSR